MFIKTYFLTERHQTSRNLCGWDDLLSDFDVCCDGYESRDAHVQLLGRFDCVW